MIHHEGTKTRRNEGSTCNSLSSSCLRGESELSGLEMTGLQRGSETGMAGMEVYRSIIITGGKGMLAHALISALKQRGLSAVAVDRDECDITQADQVDRLFKAHRPTLLLNCAAHTGVDVAEDEPAKAHSINADGPATIARACGIYGTKLIHYSTDFVFDGSLNRPYRPDDQPNPLSVYGQSKLAGEANIKLIGPSSWLIIRTSWLFGDNGNCFPQTMVKMARLGKTLRVVDDQFGSPTYTCDLAEATFRLIDAGGSGLLHVTNSGVTSWHQFAMASLSEFGVTADLSPVSTAKWLEMRPRQALRPAYSVLDTGRYQQITGFTMRDWILALHDYRFGVLKEIEM